MEEEFSVAEPPGDRTGKIWLWCGVFRAGPRDESIIIQEQIKALQSAVHQDTKYHQNMKTSTLSSIFSET
jgi:hypothetical protein